MPITIFHSPAHNTTAFPSVRHSQFFLFLIAFNKLNLAILNHKQFKFCAYADDYHIFKNINKDTQINIDRLVNIIHSWCQYSGVVLSLNKGKHLHFCKKHSCKLWISTTLTPIDNTNTLKILGITFNKKFNWTDHVASLVSSLSNRVNIIKCLSSIKFNCNHLTTLNIIKALILSKIDFGLPFYGNCTTSTIKPIKTI